MLGAKLMKKAAFDTDFETRTLELLKLRFAETTLHHCDVMLKVLPQVLAFTSFCALFHSGFWFFDLLCARVECQRHIRVHHSFQLLQDCVSRAGHAAEPAARRQLAQRCSRHCESCDGRAAAAFGESVGPDLFAPVLAQTALRRPQAAAAECAICALLFALCYDEVDYLQRLDALGASCVCESCVLVLEPSLWSPASASRGQRRVSSIAAAGWWRQNTPPDLVRLFGRLWRPADMNFWDTAVELVVTFSSIMRRYTEPERMTVLLFFFFL
jgi:hypothetical protein